jgi:cell division protein ZapA (FtsZ GTPase activity inhibitor)
MILAIIQSTLIAVLAGWVICLRMENYQLGINLLLIIVAIIGIRKIMTLDEQIKKLEAATTKLEKEKDETKANITLIRQLVIDLRAIVDSLLLQVVTPAQLEALEAFSVRVDAVSGELNAEQVESGTVDAAEVVEPPIAAE